MFHFLDTKSMLEGQARPISLVVALKNGCSMPDAEGLRCLGTVLLPVCVEVVRRGVEAALVGRLHSEYIVVEVELRNVHILARA